MSAEVTVGLVGIAVAVFLYFLTRWDVRTITHELHSEFGAIEKAITGVVEIQKGVLIAIEKDGAETRHTIEVMHRSIKEELPRTQK